MMPMCWAWEKCVKALGGGSGRDAYLPFRRSLQFANILQVKTWDKVNSGMIKMYAAEVLNKLPVMQHFLFGSILPYDGPALPVSDNMKDTNDVRRGHSHTHTDLGGAGQHEVGWGDCCGIQVPSVFAAARSEMEKQPRMRLAGPRIKQVPFD